MFTGIIETIGEIAAITPLDAGGARLQIIVPFATDLELGESVAVNGVCLTATDIADDRVAFDLLQQTLDVTNLGRLTAGDRVNLERSLRLSDRLSGHMVQGHVDEAVEILAIRPQGQDTQFDIALPASAQALVISRGSIAVDGISLTIADLRDDQFTLWIIPHTREVTNLNTKQAGDLVNLEFDLLGKYVERQLTLQRQAHSEA